jgi:hypothetical protein
MRQAHNKEGNSTWGGTSYALQVPAPPARGACTAQLAQVAPLRAGWNR